MNRFFHSWSCNDCGHLGYIEIFEMLTALPEQALCDACGSKNLTKMSNHLNNAPTDAHLQNVKTAIEKRKIDKNAVGKEIAKRRRDVGITIVQLADKAKLHPAWLIQLEGGEIDLPVDASVMYRISAALDTTIADLYNLPMRCMKDGQFYWRMPKNSDFKPVEEA